MGFLPFKPVLLESVRADINSTNEIDNSDQRLQSILSAEKSLVHAVTCRDAACNFGICQKMKRIFVHAKECKSKTQNDCKVCKQFVALCCFHSKYCQNSSCTVTFCSHIKVKIGVLKDQQEQSQHQQVEEDHHKPLSTMNKNDKRYQPYLKTGNNIIKKN
jgi:E1A/CREB-binding protein